MTDNNSAVSRIVAEAAAVSGVKAVHAPSAAAGEKIIYRYTPGKYDGDYEVFTVTMRFLSKDTATAFGRVEAVSRVLCSEGTRNVLSEDGCPVYIERKSGGGSGYIGKTGYFFVIASFEVKRQMPSDIKIAVSEVL